MLALGVFSFQAYAATCNASSKLAEFSDENRLKGGCRGDRECEISIGRLAASVKKYNNLILKDCGSIDSAAGKISTVEKNGYTNLKNSLTDAKAKVNEIVSTNDEIRREVYQHVEKQITETKNSVANHMEGDSLVTGRHNPTPNDKTTIIDVESAHRSKTLDTAKFDRHRSKSLSTDELKKEMFAPATGVEILRALREDKNEKQQLLSRLDQGIGQATAGERGLGSPDAPSSPDTKKGGGLLDSLANPSMLMGLASLGAGLMQKKNSEGSDVSGATPTAPEAPAKVSGASLAGPENSAKPDKVDLARETPKSEGTSTSPFTSSPLDIPDSDVSAKNAFAGASSQSPGGSSPGLPGGAIGGSPENPGDKAASRTPAEAGGSGEGAGAFSLGGGGGGGGMNFGSSSSDPAAHAEDPMRETLQDMAAAVDSNAAALAEGAEGQANNETLEGANSEFLFTRVKSAIQRSVKKGHVISGLTAKIR